MTLPQDPCKWYKSQIMIFPHDCCSLSSYVSRVLLKMVYDIFKRERIPEKDFKTSCICSLDVVAGAKAGESDNLCRVHGVSFGFY